MFLHVDMKNHVDFLHIVNLPTQRPRREANLSARARPFLERRLLLTTPRNSCGDGRSLGYNYGFVEYKKKGFCFVNSLMPCSVFSSKENFVIFFGNIFQSASPRSMLPDSDMTFMTKPKHQQIKKPKENNFTLAVQLDSNHTPKPKNSASSDKWDIYNHTKTKQKQTQQQNNALRPPPPEKPSKRIYEEVVNCERVLEEETFQPGLTWSIRTLPCSPACMREHAGFHVSAGLHTLYLPTSF